ncbi:MAG: hypothetical protein ACR2KZ_19735, partial [Segetibacter sp.]
LYQAIYGINPLYNRFYLNPHITSELAGTELKYNYQGQKLTIGLGMNQYSVANDKYKITAGEDFGFSGVGNQLAYFSGDNATASLIAKTDGSTKISLNIKNWSDEEMAWTQSSSDKPTKNLVYTINKLMRNSYYSVNSNGKTMRIKSNVDGVIVFNGKTGISENDIAIRRG